MHCAHDIFTAYIHTRKVGPVPSALFPKDNRMHVSFPFAGRSGVPARPEVPNKAANTCQRKVK